MLVIQDVCVIPVEGAARLPHQDVIVVDDRILSVQSTGGAFAERATIVDGRQRFLIPGLIDSHVHLWDPADHMNVEGMSRDDLNRTWLDMCLVNGVTTVLVLSGSPELLAVGKRISRGEMDGPTIHSSGPILNDPTMTYEQALAEVAEEAELGYEYVKVYNDLTNDAYRGLIEGGAKHGLPVLGHVPRAPGFDGVLASGQIAIVHVEELLYTAFDPFRASRGTYDWASAPPLRVEDLPRVCERIAEAGITVIPNATAIYAIWQQAENNAAWLRSLPEFECVVPEMLARWADPAANDYVHRFVDPTRRRNMFEAYWFLLRTVEQLQIAGVPMTAGTDFPIPGTVPGLLHFELSQLAVAGLGNAGALRAGTQAGGDFLEPGTKLGTVTPGARADLVLLDADPLEDVRHTSRVHGVMTRGVWHGPEDLAARAAALHAAGGPAPVVGPR